MLFNNHPSSSRISIEHVARVNSATSYFLDMHNAHRTQFALGIISQHEMIDKMAVEATRYALALREIAQDLKPGNQETQH